MLGPAATRTSPRRVSIEPIKSNRPGPPRFISPRDKASEAARSEASPRWVRIVPSSRSRSRRDVRGVLEAIDAFRTRSRAFDRPVSSHIPSAPEASTTNALTPRFPRPPATGVQHGRHVRAIPQPQGVQPHGGRRPYLGSRPSRHDRQVSFPRLEIAPPRPRVPTLRELRTINENRPHAPDRR